MTRTSVGCRHRPGALLRASEISYVVQGTDPNLLPFATAIQNVWFAQQGARGRGRVPLHRPEELLDFLGLGQVGNAVKSRISPAACSNRSRWPQAWRRHLA